jgi:hypothetical protein
VLSRISRRGEGRVEFGRKRRRWSGFYVGIVQKPRMYVAFNYFTVRPSEKLYIVFISFEVLSVGQLVLKYTVVPSVSNSKK